LRSQISFIKLDETYIKLSLGVKNILSISTRVELDNIYCGKKNIVELKRTISRLKEMGSNTYITKNLKNFVKK